MDVRELRSQSKQSPLPLKKLLPISWPMLRLSEPNLYPHMCTKFVEFTLKFNEWGIHFSRLPPFLRSQILALLSDFQHSQNNDKRAKQWLA